MSYYNNKTTGILGEEIADCMLTIQQYNILERNFRCRHGEIDIIAYDRTTKEIVFVEVKSRTSQKHGLPKEAVTASKQKTIKLVAAYYIYIHNLHDIPIRFDVIEIYFYSNYKKFDMNHIKQAF